MTRQLSAALVLAEAEAILLDFDGPVCGIFAGYPATTVAKELRQELRAAGIELPTTIARRRDPLEVLRWTAERGNDDLTRQVEDALCAAELVAATTARPTPHAQDVILAAHQSRRPLAIVSNNSAPAVLAYLAAHRLTGYFGAVIGRDGAAPAKMKPHPEPIMRALRALGVEPSAAVIVGDSVSDTLGAKAAGTYSIGYANKPAKAHQLTEAGANAIVHSMADIARALSGTPAKP